MVLYLYDYIIILFSRLNIMKIYDYYKYYYLCLFWYKYILHNISCAKYKIKMISLQKCLKYLLFDTFVQ